MPLLDLPENEPGLNFDKYGDAITQFINAADPPQLTIGIFGQYGTGKSTLIRSIQNKLNSSKPFNENVADTLPNAVVVNFQAWRHDNENDLMIPFLISIREHLKASDPNFDEGILENIWTTCTAIAYATKFNFGLLEIEASKALDQDNKKEKIEEYTNAYSDIVSYLKNITQDEKGSIIRRLVVFIDDLDRCEPEKALRLLEGIKAFTDIKGFIFVLALDARVIESFVSKKYGDTFNISGKEYIEKMFQVSFMLPEPSKELLLEAVSKLTLPFSTEITSLLKESLGIKRLNIRQIKRIFNFHEIISNIAPPELPRKYLLILQLVEYHWPNLFCFIKKHRVKCLDEIDRIINNHVDLSKPDNNRLDFNNKAISEIHDIKPFFKDFIRKQFYLIEAEDDTKREELIAKCINFIGSFEHV